MLEQVEYIEAILGGYLTSPARDAALHLRDLLLEKVLETVGDASDPALTRRSTRSSDDGMGMDERISSVNISQGEIQVMFHSNSTLHGM